MLKISKFLFTTFFILSGVFRYAAASDIYLFDLNVFAWKAMVPGSPNYNGGGPKFVNYIMKSQNQFDFVTTQEADNGSLPLTAGAFGNMASLYNMSGPNGDATIYYRRDRWVELKHEELPITNDKLNNGGLGPRIAGLSQFKSILNDKVITIASTHYCVPWSNSRGCNYFDKSGNIDNKGAHIKDTRDIANEIARFSPGNPVIFTGDFNTMFNDASDIQTVLANEYGISLVNYGSNPQPQPGPIDFVYFRGLAQDGAAWTYRMGNPADGDGMNLSDHDGIVAKFNFGSTPPPVACSAPTDAEITKSYTLVSPTAGNISITVNSSSSSTTGMEIWPWNYNQSGVKPMKTSQNDTISFEDKNVSGSSKYTYYVRNICQGNFSGFKAIDVSAQ